MSLFRAIALKTKTLAKWIRASILLSLTVVSAVFWMASYKKPIVIQGSSCDYLFDLFHQKTEKRVTFVNGGIHCWLTIVINQEQPFVIPGFALGPIIVGVHSFAPILASDENKSILLLNNEVRQPARVPILYRIHFKVRLWLVTFGLFILALHYWWKILILRQLRQFRKQCATCGYNLKGNCSGVCPECGSIGSNVAPTSDGV